MNAVRAVAALALASVFSCVSDLAWAYRPFDGTDAAVAETGDIEIELGPVEYLREGAERTLFAPNLRINYGFATDWEASLEGEVGHGLTNGVPGTSVVEGEALLKHVWREGSLQDKPGPSIAAEFGALLPGINDEHGTRAVLPVAEISYERDIDMFRTRSALIGGIWQVQDNIAVDFALRGALVNNRSAGEIRAGVTFAFGVAKGPNNLSGLTATALHGVR